MKNTGVWLDKNKAIIVTIEDDKEMMETILSNMDNYNVTANRHIGGAQEIVQDITYLEKEKHQFKAYFKDIIASIEETDALVLFGPAETNEKFAKALQEHHKDISIKIQGVKKADSMTDNQVKALVRDFFKSK
jgi:stalled ribosome rescue protein Dom34